MTTSPNAFLEAAHARGRRREGIAAALLVGPWCLAAGALAALGAGPPLALGVGATGLAVGLLRWARHRPSTEELARRADLRLGGRDIFLTLATTKRESRLWPAVVGQGQSLLLGRAAGAVDRPLPQRAIFASTALAAAATLFFAPLFPSDVGPSLADRWAAEAGAAAASLKDAAATALAAIDPRDPADSTSPKEPPADSEQASAEASEPSDSKSDREAGESGQESGGDAGGASGQNKGNAAGEAPGDAAGDGQGSENSDDGASQGDPADGSDAGEGKGGEKGGGDGAGSAGANSPSAGKGPKAGSDPGDRDSGETSGSPQQPGPNQGQQGERGDSPSKTRNGQSPSRDGESPKGKSESGRSSQPQGRSDAAKSPRQDGSPSRDPSTATGRPKPGPRDPSGPKRTSGTGTGEGVPGGSFVHVRLPDPERRATETAWVDEAGDPRPRTPARNAPLPGAGALGRVDESQRTPLEYRDWLEARP